MQARKIIALDRDLKTQAPQALDAKHPMHPARAACLEATVDLFRDFMRKECLPFITRDPPRRDLVEAAAHEGMYKAFIRFDPERDIPFSIFARRTVRGTIQNAMRSETLSGSPLSRQDYEAHKDLLKGIHAAAQETHQVVPTNEAVARSSGLSTELVRQSRAAHHIIANTVSLDQPINSLPGSTPLQDTLAAKTDTPDETTQTLWRVLSSLPLDSRERVILDRRFGIEVTEGRLTLWVDHTPDTQTELSASLGISQVHVSRLIARLIRKIEREIILESKGTTLPTLRLDVTPHVDK
jgi:RNA polymerase sigma-B factor